MNLRAAVKCLVIIATAITIGACAHPERQPLSQLDTPEHHTYTGMRLLNQGKYDDAEREFNLSLQLDDGFSRAYTGSGLVKAYRGEYDAAADLMKKAKKYAATDREKSLSRVGLLRIALMSKRDGWLEDAEEAFAEAVTLDADLAASYYFMGQVYKNTLQFGEAAGMFSRVLDLNDEYVREADREWKLIQKIQRALPGTMTGKKIALAESITRADLAALLLEEFRIDEVYKKFGVSMYETGFKSPEETIPQGRQQQPLASDIGDHVLAADMDEIIQIGVRGLEVFPDGSFRPDDLITRASFAMIVEDILIKIGQDQALATRFIGTPSPFSDVRNDLPYFNAIMVVTTRGIMEMRDLTSGEFGPLAPVAGADALLVIKKIKEELKIF